MVTKRVKFGPNTATKAAPVTGLVADVANSKGYLDLKVSVTKNGKAIRIANRIGTERVFITKNAVTHFIDALQHVNDANEKTSIKDIEFDVAA